MNDRDKNNLMFLLSLSERDLSKWYALASIDDQEYADWLLIEALNIVAEHITSSNIERELDSMKSFEDAKSIIDKIKA